MNRIKTSWTGFLERWAVLFGGRPLPLDLLSSWSAFSASALLLGTFVAWGNIGYYHPDEHFQILEFASRFFGDDPKTGLSWEFDEKMRSWAQPAAFALLFKVLDSLGINDPFKLATAARIASSLIAWTAMNALLSHAIHWTQDEKTRRRIIAWGFLSCFTLFIAARTSSENLATSFFLLGFSFSYRNTKPYDFFAAGAWMTAAFVVRFPIAPLVLGYALWMGIYRRPSLRQAFSVITGSLLVLGLSACIDRIGYGAWSFPAWNFLHQNLILGKAAAFTGGSGLIYFTHPARALPPLSTALLVFSILGWARNPKNPMTWACALYLGVHLYLSNRQLRFLFPLVTIAPVFAALALGSFEKSKRFVTSLLLAQNFGFIIILGLTPVHSQIGFMQALYRKIPEVKRVYSQGINPYSGVGLEYAFYKNPKIEISTINEKQNLKALLNSVNEPFGFFLSDRKDRETLALLESHCELRYRTLPSGIERFNFGSRGGWFNRTRLWSLYLCPANGPRSPQNGAEIKSPEPPEPIRSAS